MYMLGGGTEVYTRREEPKRRAPVPRDKAVINASVGKIHRAEGNTVFDAVTTMLADAVIQRAKGNK